MVQGRALRQDLCSRHLSLNATGMQSQDTATTMEGEGKMNKTENMARESTVDWEVFCSQEPVSPYDTLNSAWRAYENHLVLSQIPKQNNQNY